MEGELDVGLRSEVSGREPHRPWEMCAHYILRATRNHLKGLARKWYMIYIWKRVLRQRGNYTTKILLQSSLMSNANTPAHWVSHLIPSTNWSSCLQFYAFKYVLCKTARLNCPDYPVTLLKRLMGAHFIRWSPSSLAGLSGFFTVWPQLIEYPFLTILCLTLFFF